MYGQGSGSSLGCVSEWTYNLNLIHYNHQRQADPSSNSGLIYFSFCLSLSLPWYLSCQTQIQFLYLSFFRSFLYLYIAPFFVFSLAFKCELNLSLLRLFFYFFYTYYFIQGIFVGCYGGGTGSMGLPETLINQYLDYFVLCSIRSAIFI